MGGCGRFKSRVARRDRKEEKWRRCDVILSTKHIGRKTVKNMIPFCTHCYLENIFIFFLFSFTHQVPSQNDYYCEIIYTTIHEYHEAYNGILL